MKFLSISLLSLLSYGMLFAAPDSMLDRIDQAVNNSQWEEALRLTARYDIEARLAIACSTDNTTQAALDQLTVRALGNYKGYEKLKNAISKKRFKEIFSEQLAAVEKDFNDNKLEKPDWVARYGMGAYLKALSPSGSAEDESSFFPETQWHEKRKQVLEKYKQAINGATK